MFSPPSSTLNLTGMLLSGDVYVICNNSAATAFKSLADTLHSVTSWSGDDAVELVANGTTIDVIGQIGFDPGSAWTNSGVSTRNQTRVRKQYHEKRCHHSVARDYSSCRSCPQDSIRKSGFR